MNKLGGGAVSGEDNCTGLIRSLTMTSEYTISASGLKFQITIQKSILCQG